MIRVASQRSPRPVESPRRHRVRASARAAYRPRSPSSTEAGPSAPAAASRAARMPDCEASPGCSCLVDEPVARNSSSPPAWLPAMPRALTVVSLVQAHQSSRDQRRGEHAAHRGGVQAACVEGVRGGAGDPADRFIADDGGDQALLAGGPDLFTDGEQRWAARPRWRAPGRRRGCRRSPARAPRCRSPKRGGRRRTFGRWPNRVASAGPPRPAATRERGRRRPQAGQPPRAVPSPSSRCRETASTTVHRHVVEAQPQRPLGQGLGRGSATPTWRSTEGPVLAEPGHLLGVVAKDPGRARGRRPRCAAGRGGTPEAGPRRGPARRPAGPCRSAGARSRRSGRAPRCAARPARPRRR